MLSAHFLPSLFRRVVFSLFRGAYSTCLISGLLLVATLEGCSRSRGPLMPSFNLLLVDSTTVLASNDIPTGRPIVVIYFSPDCEHCQAETAGLLAKMDALKEVRFYFITTDPFERLRVFQKYYHLSGYSNVVLGKDYLFSFYTQLKPTGTPSTFIYDRDKTLKAVLTGDTGTGTIISLTKTI